MADPRAHVQKGGSRRIAVDVFEHPRLAKRMRVSTIEFGERQSYGIAAAPEMGYGAETAIFVGEPGQEELRDLIRYRDREAAEQGHAAIIARSRP